MDEMSNAVLMIGTEMFIVQPIEPYEIQFVGLPLNINKYVQTENQTLIIPNWEGLPDQAHDAFNAKPDDKNSVSHVEEYHSGMNDKANNLNRNVPKSGNYETHFQTCNTTFHEEYYKFLCRREPKERIEKKTEYATDDLVLQLKVDESVPNIEDTKIKVEDEEVETQTENLNDTSGTYNKSETFDETQLLPFVCEICGKMFSEVCTLNLHYVVHKYEEMIAKVQDKIDETLVEMKNSKTFKFFQP